MTGQSILSTAFLVAALVLASCELIGPDEDGDLRDLTDEEKEIVESDNRFGLSLFREINKAEADSNVFISPFSVSMALSMTLNGAAGQTLEDMKNTLEVKGLTMEQINQANKSLMELLQNIDPKVNFQVANSIWYREQFEVLARFIEVNQTYFDAEISEENFASPEAVTKINNWVKDKTNGRIEEIIDEIAPDVMMYLINAIYFKGTWLYEFDPDDTKKAPFYLADGTSTEVDMMSQKASLAYYGTDDYLAVDLPYGNGQFSMTAILPNQEIGVDGFIADLTEEKWSDLTSRLEEKDVTVFMPKFELTYDKELKDVLSALGMEIAFSDGADFSGINPDRDLYISRVLHKANVTVDEEGTEAAAVTAVEIRETSVGLEEQVVRLDRPFIFVIREHHSGSILFMGKMANPSA